MINLKAPICCKTIALAYFLSSIAWAQPVERVDVGRFSQNDISGWKVRKFAGTTGYSLTLADGKRFIKADSQQSASAYYKKIKVDLEKTPILNWSWLKEKSIDPGAELDKEGDDYVARIFVVKSGGLFWWKTIALNYVWSFEHEKNDTWNNPFGGDKSKMLAQRDASDPQGVWFSERRNVRTDFARLHGLEIRQIDGVAIMTDSDNSGLSAKALYGDIYFSAE